MDDRGMIPTRTHMYADYLVGVLLIAAPWLFGFADDTTTGTWISVIAGAGLILMSMITDYEGGFIARLIPMRMHLAADGVVGLVLAASPWLFDFADEGVNAWLPFVAIGVGEIALALTTRRVAGTERSQREPHLST
jgi:hypothetical protein